MSSFMDSTPLCCAKLKANTLRAALCDNCSTASGPLAWQVRQSQAARRELQIRSRLNDLYSCYPYCTAVFLGKRTSLDWAAILLKEQLQHSLWECIALSKIRGVLVLDRFRTAI